MALVNFEMDKFVEGESAASFRKEDCVDDSSSRAESNEEKKADRTNITEHDQSKEKVNEQSETGNGIFTNEMEDDWKMGNVFAESDSNLFNRIYDKDRKYYFLLAMIWVLSLFTRLYDIAQPPKIW